MDMQFEWDENKNKKNIQKHKVSFEEAKTCFYDDRARLIPDPDHSIKEERYILLGISVNFRLLIVCHKYLEKLGIIRIFSSRKATKEEQRIYKEGD
ncbi:MAG: BrnT family toxin [Leptospiraceae bacterium]|nr:BrnT family toxin [Leptospiraceae bacterium]